MKCTAQMLMLVAATFAGEMTLHQFKEAPLDIQRGAVMGVMAVTDTLGIRCKVPATVAEYVAALNNRPLEASAPWVTLLLSLMDEKQCTLGTIKPDA